MPEHGDATVGAARAEPLRERRLFRRYDIDLEAKLRAGDRVIPCTIHDLSLGGAGLSPALGEFEGRAVRLLWKGLDLPDGLPATVVRTSAERTHLTFDLDEDAETALTMFLLTAAEPGG
jgi:hypothetical protein